MVDIHYQGPPEEFEPTPGANQPITVTSITTSIVTPPEKIAYIDSRLDELEAYVRDLIARCEDDLSSVDLLIPTDDFQLQDARDVELPSGITASSRIPFAFYKRLETVNTASAEYIRSRFEEAARDIGGKISIDILPLAQAILDEALISREFLNENVLGLANAGETRSVINLQASVENSLWQAAFLNNYFQNKDSQFPISTADVDSLSPSEASEAQALFKYKLNENNNRVRDLIAYVRRMHANYADVFYKNQLGPAINWERQSSFDTFLKPDNLVAQDVHTTKFVLTARMAQAIVDQQQRMTSFNDQMQQIKSVFDDRIQNQAYIAALQTQGVEVSSALVPTTGTGTDFEQAPVITTVLSDFSASHQKLVDRDDLQCHTAFAISLDAIDGVDSTNVQDAIAELGVQRGHHPTFDAITLGSILLDPTQPLAATGLEATVGALYDDVYAIFEWIDPALGATPTSDSINRYQIELAQSPSSGSYLVGDSFVVWNTITRVSKLLKNKSYAFRVAVVNRIGVASTFSPWFEFRTGQDHTAPSGVSGLSAVGDYRGILVRWIQNQDIDVLNAEGTYRVDVSASSNFASPITQYVPGTVVNITDLLPGITYYIRVQAIDKYDNKGPWSNTVTASTRYIQGIDIGLATIQAANIASGVISGGSIGTGTVTGENIAPGTITGGNLVPGTIGPVELADFSVLAAKLAANAVTTAALADLSVINAKLANNAVTVAKLADLSVTTAKLAANAVTVAELANGAVTTAKLAANAVTLSQLADAAVVASKIADNAVTVAKLADSAVTAAKIADGSILTAKLAANAVTLSQLSDNSVNTAKIIDDSITAAKIAANAVTVNELADGSVVSSKIAANAVTVSQIADGSITSAKLASDTAVDAVVADGAITTAKLADNAVSQTKLADATISAAKLIDGAVSATKLGVRVSGDNLILDSSFESSVFTRYWVQGVALKWTRATTTPALGLANAKCVNSSTTTSENLTSFLFPITPGASNISGRFVFRTSSNLTGAGLVVSFFDSSGTTTGTNTLWSQTSIPVAWSEVVLQAGNAISIPANSVKGQLIIVSGVSTNGSAATFEIDAVYLGFGDLASSWAPNAAEILPGAVIGDMIQANTITATQIAANTITAAQIAVGTITATQIAANTVTAAKIAAGTITTNEIAAGTISATNIAAGTILASNIAAGTITASNIAANAITSTQIAANAVIAGKIAAGVVTATEIAAGTITATQIAANTVTAAKIAAGTITTTEIAAGTITATNIHANAITAAQISAFTITAAQIASNTITAAQIAVGTITATEIAAGTITTAKLAAQSITAALIATNTITAVQIAANTITAAQIAAGTITATEILAGTITASKIATNTITASQIAAGTITSNEIAAGTITALNIAAGTIVAGNIHAGAITSNEILAGTITAAQIASHTIVAANIAAGSITATEILSGTITAIKIAANTVTAAQIAAGTITSNEILAGTITALNIAANTITAAQIAANTITAGQIAANTITAGQILANTITAGQIAAFTITAAQIAAGTITATNIAANTITASNIAADTITATEIAASAITTSELAAGAVTAAKITANTITAAQIAAGTITATEISANTITADKLTTSSLTSANITLNGGSFRAGTNPGGASPTGQGMIINSSGASFYNTAGTRTIFLDATTGSGAFTGTIASSIITGGTITGAIFYSDTGPPRFELSGSTFIFNQGEVAAGYTSAPQVDGYLINANAQSGITLRSAKRTVSSVVRAAAITLEARLASLSNEMVIFGAADTYVFNVSSWGSGGTGGLKLWANLVNHPSDVFLTLFGVGSFGGVTMRFAATNGYDLQIQNQALSAWSPVSASAFTVVSDKSSKEKFSIPKYSALDVIIKAGVQEWNYKDSDCVGVDRCIGPVASDLPSHLVKTHKHPKTNQPVQAVNLTNLIGLAWKAIEELSSQVQDLKLQISEK